MKNGGLESAATCEVSPRSAKVPRDLPEARIVILITRYQRYPFGMGNRNKLLAAAMAIGIVALLAVTTRARVIERKARGVVPGMTVSEVMQRLDGWWMINTHPESRRAIPHGTGPEFNGYSGEVYVLTPVQPDGRETDLGKISRAEFEARLERLLSAGEPWTVYFNYRNIPTDTGILVRFDGKGRIAVSR